MTRTMLFVVAAVAVGLSFPAAGVTKAALDAHLAELTAKQDPGKKDDKK